MIAFTAVCAGLHLQLNPLAAQCWFSLANLIEVGGTIVLAIIVALLALAALYRTGMIAAAEEYRDELLAYAESVYNDDVAFCNLQYGG